MEERRPAGRAQGYYGPRTYDEFATVVNNGFYASPELFERIVDVADANTANHGLAMSSSSSSSSGSGSTRRYRSGPKNGLFKLTLVSRVAKDLKERKAVVDVDVAARYARLGTSTWSRASQADSVPGWLLRSAVPLSPLATQHLLPRRVVVALHMDRTNQANGLIRLSQRRPLDVVHDVVASDASYSGSPRLRAVFQRFGVSRPSPCASPSPAKRAPLTRPPTWARRIGGSPGGVASAAWAAAAVLCR